MDLSMAIRTLVVDGERCTASVGGAIVADSEPSKEYQETLDKAAALCRAFAAYQAGRGADQAPASRCRLPTPRISR
jgi:anthranilate synthase component 1